MGYSISLTIWYGIDLSNDYDLLETVQSKYNEELGLDDNEDYEEESLRINDVELMFFRTSDGADPIGFGAELASSYWGHVEPLDRILTDARQELERVATTVDGALERWGIERPRGMFMTERLSW